MHNRGRMLAASFLVKHLHLDWRVGEIVTGSGEGAGEEGVDGEAAGG